MGTCYVITLPNGSLAVTRLGPNPHAGDAEKAAVWQARALAKTKAALGAVGEYQEYDETELPVRDQYRNAWTMSNGKVVKDAAKVTMIDRGERV